MRNEIAILSKTCVELALMRKTKHLRIGGESFFKMSISGTVYQWKFLHASETSLFRQFYMALVIIILTSKSGKFQIKSQWYGIATSRGPARRMHGRVGNYERAVCRVHYMFPIAVELATGKILTRSKPLSVVTLSASLTSTWQYFYF